MLSLSEVLTLIDRGDTFHTVSVSTGKVARVVPVTCDQCGGRIIRSTADAVADNNLDKLPDCQQ